MSNTTVVTTGLIRRRLSARARLRHFDAVLKIAELGTVKRAAEALAMSQPAVTHLLADLESLLGAPLFHRHARGMRPTALGAAWLPLVRRMLTMADAVAEQAASLMTVASGVVRLATDEGGITGCLAKVLPDFARLHPHILVQVQQADPNALRRLAAEGEVDLVVGQAPGAIPDGWKFTPLQADRFAILAGPQHPLARRRRISLESLLRETWLALPPDSQAMLAFEALFLPTGQLPPMRLVSGRFPSLLWAMLTQDRLLTLVPLSMARQLLDAGLLVELPAPQPLPFRPQGMLIPENEDRPAVQLLVGFVRNHLEAVD